MQPHNVAARNARARAKIYLKSLTVYRVELSDFPFHVRKEISIIVGKRERSRERTVIAQWMMHIFEYHLLINSSY